MNFIMDPMASSFKRWVARAGKSILHGACSEGSVDEHGDPVLTYTHIAIYGIVGTIRREIVQQEEGILVEHWVNVDVAVDQAMNERDHAIIDGVTYLVGPVEVRDTHKRFTGRRIVQ